MTTNLTKSRFLLALVVILAFMVESASAGDTIYQRLILKEDISIEVPSHWFVHSDAENKNFEAASKASLQTAGIDYDTTENKSRLLAVSALPTPSSAKIRVNVIRPLDFSEADLQSATDQDLKELKTDFSSEMAKSVIAIGGKLLSVTTPRIESFNNTTAILFEYRRSDLRVPSPWTVRIYRIPARDRLIELTISFRESDAVIFKPILEHTKRSLRF